MSMELVAFWLFWEAVGNSVTHLVGRDNHFIQFLVLFLVIRFSFEELAELFHLFNIYLAAL